MKTPINKPPKSKIVQVINEDKNKRFLVKESLKGKWKYFAVEFKKDKFTKQANRINTIAEQIALRQQLVNAGTVENFLLSTSSYPKNTAEDRTNILQDDRGS